MFRRKEENSPELIPSDSATPQANGSASPASSSGHASSPLQESGAPVSSSSTAPSSYAPRALEQPQPRPATAPAASAASSAPYRPAPISNSSSDLNRTRVPESRPVATPVAANDKTGKPSRRILTVGNDIFMRGEITTCDRLVIEGRVDAKISEVHTLELAETGSFKGQAEVEDAEISGIFEGDIIVRNRLVIYSTGKVTGKITYGEVEIERGGELTGEVKTVAGANAAKGTGAKSAPDVQKQFAHAAA